MTSNADARIDLVVACVIKKGQEILICKSPKWTNKWVVPGGHIEYGETILGAAVRETKEEVGLSVKPINVIGFGEAINPAEFYRPGHIVYFICLLEMHGTSEVVKNEEISDFRWASIREAKNLDLAPIHRSIIEAYEKQESL